MARLSWVPRSWENLDIYHHKLLSTSRHLSIRPLAVKYWHQAVNYWLSTIDTSCQLLTPTWYPWYVHMQPIFLHISFNIIANRQFLPFTPNKMQNFIVYYTYMHTCCTSDSIVFWKSVIGPIYSVSAVLKPKLCIV